MTILAALTLLVGCGDTPEAAPSDAIDSASLFRTKDDGGYVGDFNYCDGATLCTAGEGDCDASNQCASGLSCGINNGAQFSLYWSTDVCVATHCVNGFQDADETGIDFGGADCGDICGGTNGDNEGFCTRGCPCAEGEGDCDGDSECEAGLVCTNNAGPDYGLASTVDVCTPVQTGNDLQPGDLVITEIMNNPDGTSDANGEWFEVYNASGRILDLDGLVVRDDGTDSFTVGFALFVFPREHVVFGVEEDDTANGGVVVAYDYPDSISLANGADEIILETPGGTEIDRVEWDGGPTWPDLTGQSMNLDRAAYSGDNNDGSNWCAATMLAPIWINSPDQGTPTYWNTFCP